MGFNSQDGNTARKAQDMANSWVKVEKCDHALQKYGLSSVGDALNKIHFSGDNQNVWNGRNSMYVTNFRGPNDKILTLPVSTYFANNKSSVGAIVTTTQWGPQMFLGYAFFDPSIAGVKPGWDPYARALMMMHESIHLAGFGDAVFGGSKQLTNILIDNCYPAVKQYLGGLVQ
jgi:hypothetical protein